MRRKGRTIDLVEEGSEEADYLDRNGAHANAGGQELTRILARSDPRIIEVWEKFLRGTRKK